jgi:hypothetical protein
MDTRGGDAGSPRVVRPVCEECGQVHERCIRHNREGQPCNRYPVRGTTVCAAPSHGGLLPRVKAAAARNVVEEKIRRSIAGSNAAPIDDPYAELLRLAGQVVSWKDTLANIVDSMSGAAECPDCGASVPGAGGWRYEASGAGTEQLRSELVLFERGLDRCGATLGMIAKLDIEDRMARIHQRQADALIAALNAGLAAADVSGEAATRARHAAAKVLRSAA